jgi:hypothetical protein
VAEHPLQPSDKYCGVMICEEKKYSWRNCHIIYQEQGTETLNFPCQD